MTILFGDAGLLLTIQSAPFGNTSQKAPVPLSLYPTMMERPGVWDAGGKVKAMSLASGGTTLTTADVIGPETVAICGVGGAGGGGVNPEGGTVKMGVP